MNRTGRTAGAALLAACAAFAATPFAAAQAPGQPQAQAAMKDAEGKPLGTVTLTQFPQGLLIHAELDGLKPGDRVVSSGQLKLTNGAAVVPTEASALVPPQPLPRN